VRSRGLRESGNPAIAGGPATADSRGVQIFQIFFGKGLKFRSRLPIKGPWEPLREVLERGATMGISPISNLLPLPESRAIQADLEPLPMQRVENSSRAGDETYSPGNGKSSRGSEDDTAEEEHGEVAGEPEDPSVETGRPRPISFFA
jgi:hypothetical protein